MGSVCMVVISAATSVVVGLNTAVMLAAQQPGRAAERTDKGLYLLKVVEPGYDVTVKEVERAPRYSVLEMTGLVPTVTAGGVVLFRALHDIAKERGFEYTFSPPPPPGQPTGARGGSEGRRVSVVTKVFMTNDAKMALKELMGADYTDEAQKLFDLRGYLSVAALAKMFGGRGGGPASNRSMTPEDLGADPKIAESSGTTVKNEKATYANDLQTET